MNEQVNQTTDPITDDELADVVRIARKERGGKSVKYIELEKYRESIVKLMQQDVQLRDVDAPLRRVRRSWSPCCRRLMDDALRTARARRRYVVGRI